ncbi:MAG TPA: FAD-dependent oxidoreductase [Spirochaetota bacterium]|nr:FAD-dependent oxidoreductase [Spirochaetota bacterium]
MEQKKIIIAGLGSAGFAALVTIKRINPKAHVVVIDPKDKDIVHPCGLPYALEGKVNEQDLQQDIFLSRMNVEKVKGIVHSVDAEKKEIAIQYDDKTITLQFDTIILCTGYKPQLPPIAGIEHYIHKGVYTLSSIDDLKRIKNDIQGKGRAIVIGAGAIGLEVACGLKAHGLTVTVIEAKEVLPQAVDSDMAQLVAQYCANQNIAFITHSPVTAIEKRDSEFSIRTPEKEYTADIVIVATGFAANCEWAINSSFETGKWGVVVNEHLEIKPSIYAAGDCIQNWSVIDNKPFAVKLATSAYKQGIVAAEHAMGLNSAYKGTAGTFVTKVGELEIAATGFSTQVAQERGFSVIAGKISATVKPEYFPENERLTFKVLCDTKGKLLGAQAIGNGAAARINIISLAIEHGLTIDDILPFEMAYCPAVSEVNDILFKACEFAKRRIK